MTSKHDDEYDDNQAVAWMAEADPAAHLEPLPQWKLAAIKQSAMWGDTPVSTAPPRRRRMRLAVGATATALAIVGAGVLALPRAEQGAVTALTAESQSRVMSACAVPTAEALATSTIAFKGTVTSIHSGTATLEVDDIYTGDVEQIATVPQGDPANQIDGAAPVFVRGNTYLIAALDGVVRSCGQSGPDTPELQALYNQAF